MPDDIVDNNIAFVTNGTTGDAAPFIALARQCVALGAEVRLLTNTDHAALSRRYNIPFHGISDPDWPQIGRDADAFFEQVVIPGYRETYAYLAAMVTEGRRPLIVSRSGHWGAQFTAERLELPFMRVTLQPCAIRRDGHPVSLREKAALNRFRLDIGLPPLPFPNLVAEDTRHTISLFPYDFGLPQSAWPEAGKCVGFVYLDEADFVPDAELLDFLDRHGPPVVFSLGTGMQDIEPFFTAACHVCERLAMPVIFLSPHIAADKAAIPPMMMVRAGINHHFLLPRAHTLVHNGGIGTVAQALRAGVHQIIVPLLFDQPDNAARTVRFLSGRTR